MELSTAGIVEQPFRTHGTPLVFVSYQGELAAREFLESTYRTPHGLGLFQGPSLAGKSTIIRRFVESLHADAPSSVINGKKLDAKAMLERVLVDFGFDLKLDTLSELLNLVKVYAKQQAAAHDAPLIVIENTHALKADALQVLCDLAALRAGYKSALRIVLSSDRPLAGMMNAPAMTYVSKRLTGTFNLVPMDEEETFVYVHRKLEAGGCDDADRLVPPSVCAELYEASGGWPGIVDRLMLLALARAESSPLSLEHIERPVVPPMTGEPGLQVVETGKYGAAKLFLTRNGQTLREIPLDRPRIMVGRSEHNDIAISSRFISRHHALFIRDGGTTLLMDLNSTNGTFVNSQRVSNHIMVHDDVVNLGNHGLKFSDPTARRGQPLQGADFNDTVIMKSLGDMRRLLAHANTQVLDMTDETGTDSD